MADPALVFHGKADRPGTHVLLIGIGDYPWLEGGDKCTTPRHHENAMGMGQLASPPISMRKLADCERPHDALARAAARAAI